MQHWIQRTVIVSGLLTLHTLALAQAVTSPPATATAPAAVGTAGPGTLPWAEAEVRRVDAAAGKISLRHGEIKNLDMPPMTMVFQVRDPAQLAALKAGDKIRFTADKVLGAYTVIDLQAAP